MKTAVLRAVSHDLGSPLMAILTAAGALSHGELSLDLEDRRELTETILGEAERLARIVRNLLDLSRVTSSRSCGRCARAFAVQATRSIRVHPPLGAPRVEPTPRRIREAHRSERPVARRRRLSGMSCTSGRTSRWKGERSTGLP